MSAEPWRIAAVLQRKIKSGFNAVINRGEAA
jgi:hypothetical protein